MKLTGSVRGETLEIDPDVLSMVRRQLERDPPPSTTALYGRATRVNRDIYQLSLRQFHAMYPLRVKREKARDADDRTAPDAGPGNGAPPRVAQADSAREDDADPGEAGEHAHPVREDDGGGDPDAGATLRSRVRSFFFGMARDVVDAEEPGDVVELVQGLDVRVDELIRLLEGREAVS